MSDHRVLINADMGATHFSELIDGGANKEGMLARAGQVLDGIDGGVFKAKVRVNVGMTKATGTITFASIAAADTVTVNGVTITGDDTPDGSDTEFETGVSDESSANSLRGVIAGSATAKIVGCVSARRRGTVQLASFVATDTVTINGLVFTGVATPADGSKVEFAIGLTDAVSAANLLALASAHSDLTGVVITRSTDTLTFNYLGTLTLAASAHATVASDIVVVEAIVPGQIGNLCTLAISARGSVSGANLTGGLEGTQYVYSKSSTQVV